ncbi:MAG: hypothetical protein ACYTDY_01050 [Planctomycetota bacterium]|jgi:hypothetical protein
MRALLVAPALLLLLAAEKPPEPKLLPTAEEGFGLAAKYPGDRSIARDKRVVFTEGFEDPAIEKRWTQVKKRPGSVSFVTGKSEIHSGKRSLRIDYRRGKGTGGHLYKMLERGHERLHFRFYVRFPKDHGYVHHFVHLCGYEPPTRWPQGGAGTRPKGDERFTTGLDVYGDWGRTQAPGRWGLYSYWCEMKGSRDGKFWGNEPKGGKRIPVATERWICAEFMIRCNTVGKSDGEQAFWIDGKCAGRWGGYRWRKDPKLKVNAAWLLYYITDDAVRRGKGKPKDEHVLFDDIVLATEYVGPMKLKSRR